MKGFFSQSGVLKRGRKLLGGLEKLDSRIRMVEQQVEDIKLQQGKTWGLLNSKNPSTDIRDHEFRVFSQWGEDGIIDYLVRNVEIKNRSFIEFGVQDFRESNCRFLMMSRNWHGFIIDGSEENIKAIKNQRWFWMHEIDAVASFITRENIRGLIDSSGLGEDLGLLSVDIDGVDYWVLEAITNIKPRIIVVEYNSVFGSTRKISVPYDAEFRRQDAHYSRLYFGASLAGFVHLLGERGYSLVGTESAGVNAFFVRRELLNDRVRPVEVAGSFVVSAVRESRDQDGRRDFLGGCKRIESIRGLPVVNVETGQIEVL